MKSSVGILIRIFEFMDFTLPSYSIFLDEEEKILLQRVRSGKLAGEVQPCLLSFPRGAAACGSPHSVLRREFYTPLPRGNEWVSLFNSDVRDLASCCCIPKA